MDKNYRDLFDLSGRVALVVGGTGGIGRDIALALAQYGADVIIASRRPEAGEEVVKAMAATGRRCTSLKADILNAGDLRNLMDTIDNMYGQLDILVNAAGTNVWQKAEEYSEENWDKVVDTNLKGVFLTCREAGRLMIRQRRGKIINISSVRGKLGFPENYTAYCASKGGLNLYTKCLAAEWAKYNINVNAIAPTFIETPLVSNMLADPETYNRLVNRIPLRRIGMPGDLVGAAIFFASRASDFITGQILYVDGGVTCTQ